MFWQAHSKHKQQGDSFLNEDFRLLVTGLLQHNPTVRLSLAEVVASKWMNDSNIATHEDVVKEFTLRK